MCEILLFVKDMGTSGILAQDTPKPKQGDVCTVLADGSDWGTAPLGGAKWGDIPAHVQAYPGAGLNIGDRYFINEFNDGSYSEWDQTALKMAVKFDPARVSVAGPLPISQHIHGNHNFWRLLKLPNVTIPQAQQMLQPEQPAAGMPNQILQFRQFYFDKSKIVSNAAFLAHWNDDTRAAQFITLPYTAAQLQTVVSKRTAVVSS